MMDVFLVWDEMNGDESDARRIEADDAESAAIEYAERDGDGWTDGLYINGPHPIAVRDPDGNLHRFDVRADLEPTFRAVAVTSGPEHAS